MKRERYEELKEEVPILLRIINKFPANNATVEEIERITDIEFPEVWLIICKYRTGISKTGNRIEWSEESIPKIRKLEAELAQLEKEFGKKSILSRLDITKNLIDVIKGIVIGFVVGYLIGRFGRP